MKAKPGLSVQQFSQKENILYETVRHTVHSCGIIDVIYYYVIWTDNGSMLPETNVRRQEGEISNDKSIAGLHPQVIITFSQFRAILYRTGNTQFAILLSFVASSSLSPCGLQSTHPPVPSYISPYVVYNIYGWYASLSRI